MQHVGQRASSGASSEQVKDKASSMADQARGNAARMADQARERADMTKGRAAEGMQRAAETVRDTTAQSGGITARAGTQIAEGIESAAGYLQENSAGQMIDDFELYVREHPMQAVAGAIFAGFVIGRMIR